MARPRRIAKIVLCNSDNTKVEKYESKKYNQQVCRKIKYTSSKQSADKFMNESKVLDNLKSNENVVHFISSSCTFKQGKFYCKIITKYCENGNLRVYMRKLKSEGKNFNDSILKHIQRIVTFFSILQKKNIYHRDIKPDNIFITDEGNMKIGDFGASKSIMNNNDLVTIAGTVVFLSPEMRAGYDLHRKRIGPIQIAINPFKSDVYCLGLVFLSMASMKEISESFTELENLSDLLDSWLQKIRDDKVKKIIYEMTKIDHQERMDFFKLKDFVDEIIGESYIQCENCGVELICCLGCSTCQRVLLYQCPKCNEESLNSISNSIICNICNEGKIIECPQCYNIYPYCCSRRDLDLICPCGNILIVFCVICENITIKDRLYLCESCYKEASKVNTFNLEGSGSIALRDKWKCKFHKNTMMDLMPNKLNYYCNECAHTICYICKQTAHGSLPCFRKNNERYSFKCVCRQELSLYDIDCMFYTCPKCQNFRCMICFESNESDHQSCAQLFMIGIKGNNN